MVLDNIPIKKTEINILWIPPENDRRGYRRKEGLWSYVFINENLLKMCGTADINEFIKKQQKKYVTHLVR